MIAHIDDIHSIRRREAQEQGDMQLRFGSSVIHIPLRFQRYVESLEQEVDRLEQRVHRLETGSVGTINVPDQMAEVMVVAFIKRQQSEGKMFVDAIDIVAELHLPLQQISKILEKLKSRGLKESD